MTKNKKKELGQVFTPEYIVDMILDEVGYVDENMINKKIIEPSFGNGAFILRIVRRLIDYCKLIGMPKEDIIAQIENNIYGIEIDSDLFIETKTKLKLLLSLYDIEDDINWKLLNQNTLNYKEFDFFDYVVGNPPYIRVHNLGEETKEIMVDFKYSNGTTDMYILFFELCIKLLNNKGKLGFITPNSFMKNTSQGEFRKYLIEENLISKIIDFKSSNIFEDAKTYNAISVIDKNKSNYNLCYSQYDKYTRLYLSDINLLDYVLNNQASKEPWNFNSEEDNNLFLSIKNRSFKLGQYCNVQYGIATNKNVIYISNPTSIKGKKNIVLFNGYEIEKQLLKPVVKGSTYDGNDTSSYILFPYEWDADKRVYVPIREDILSKKYPLGYKYLLDHREELEKRDMDKGATTWYQFARSQGLTNSRYKKLVFKHIISANRSEIEVFELPEDTIVYSGIYITVQNEDYFSKIKSILSSKEFCKYCILVGKDMRGGYKSITSKHIKSYGLNQIVADELIKDS